MPVGEVFRVDHKAVYTLGFYVVTGFQQHIAPGLRLRVQQGDVRA